MPPRAPVIWATTGVGAERFRKHLDERHRELSVQAKLRSRTYRRSRADPAQVQGRLKIIIEVNGRQSRAGAPRDRDARHAAHGSKRPGLRCH